MTNPWANLRTFRDVLHLYVEYLSGRLAEIPTYSGPLNADTVAQLGDIREINRLGLLTVDSQDGLTEETKTDGHNYQRAYITAVAPTNFVQRVAERLYRSSDVLVFHQAMNQLPHDPNVRRAVDRAAMRVPLTVERTHPDVDPYGTAFTTLPPVADDSFAPALLEFGVPQSFVNGIRALCSTVTFIDTQFGRKGTVAATILGVLRDLWKTQTGPGKYLRTDMPLPDPTIQMVSDIVQDKDEQQRRGLLQLGRTVQAQESFWMQKAMGIARQAKQTELAKWKNWTGPSNFDRLSIEALTLQAAKLYKVGRGDLDELSRFDLGVLLFPFTRTYAETYPNGNTAQWVTIF